MGAFRFPCPGCKAVLQLANAPAPGKSIKCPKCGTSFVPALSEAAPRPVAEAPRSAPPPAVEDEDREERRSRRPLKKKKNRQEAKSNAALIAGVVVGCVLLLGVAVTLAVIYWPSGDKKDLATGPPPQTPSKPLLEGKGGRPPVPPGPGGRQAPGDGNALAPNTPTNPPSAPRPRESFDFASLDLGNLFLGDLAARSAQDLDGLRWVPAEHNLVAGLDVSSLASKPALANAMEKLLGSALQGSPLDGGGLGVKDIDHVVLSAKGDVSQVGAGQDLSRMDAFAVIIKTKTKLDRAKIAQAAKAGPPTQFKTKQYHIRQDGLQNTFLIFPSDDTLIFAALMREPIDTLLQVEGNGLSLAPPVLATLKHVGPAHFWLAAPATQQFAQLPPELAALPPDLKPLLEIMKKGKASAVGARLGGNQLRLNFTFTFPDESVCQEAAKALQEAWTKQGKPILDGAKALAPPALSALLSEVSDGLRVRSQGDTVVASLEAKFKTIDTLVKAAQQGQLALNPDMFKPKEPPPIAEKPPAGEPPGKSGGLKVGFEVGNLAPEIEGQDTDGKKFKLSDYRGKVVVLDFWGHW